MKEMKKKQLIISIMVLIITMGCGKNELIYSGNVTEVIVVPTSTEEVVNSPTPENIPTLTPEPQKLKVFFADYVLSETDELISESVIHLFNQKYSNEVEVIYGTYADYEQILIDLQNGESEYDLIQFSPEYLYLKEDYLLDIDYDFSSKHFVPLSIESLKKEENVIGIPLYLEIPLLYCREDILEENNLEVPKSFTDVVELMDKSSLINYLGELVSYGYVSDGQVFSFEEFLMLANGEIFYLSGEINFDTVEIRTILEFFFDRFNTVESISDKDLLFSSKSLLETGKVVCLWGNSDSLPASENEIWENIIVARMFSADGRDIPLSLKTGWLGIPESSDNYEDALNLMTYFSKDIFLDSYNQQLGTMSPIREDFEESNNAYYYFHRKFPGYQKLEEIFYWEVNKYIRGVQDIETTIDNIELGNK